MSLERAALAAAVAAHGPVMRVVITRVDGSAPREVGAAMLVWAGGQAGTIGGGALEHEAARRARAMLAANVARQHDKVPLGPSLGQCCGGAVGLLSERFDAAAVDGLPDAVFARPIEGSDTDPPLTVQRLLAAARGAGRLPPPQLVQGWMVEPLATAARPLWIFGAGHVGRALVDVLAPLPGFALSWVDFAAERFPDALPDGVTRLVAANPADLVRHAPVEARHLIVTHSHTLDLELCHAVLRHGFAGAGLIGSSTKWARFRSRLAQLGHSEAQISRICCPIGQPALGKHPQAIAVGVATQLLSLENEAATARGATG